MMTIEEKSRKKCCLYASDFHLEMILLPYIKERIDKSKIMIVTQNDLSDTIKILLDRVNIDKKQKNKILDLNWGKDYIQHIDNNEETNIIINGDCNYINNINSKLKGLNVNIVNCFSINDTNLNIDAIKKEYKEVLNTSKI